MANIMINEDCNQKCPYCFASEFVNVRKNDITFDNFVKATKKPFSLPMKTPLLLVAKMLLKMQKSLMTRLFLAVKLCLSLTKMQ